MSKAIRIVSLDCWHANCLIYQAEGFTDAGRYVLVHYRRPYFSVGVYDGPADDAPGGDVFVTDAHPDHRPYTITLQTLKAWTAERVEEPEIIWPDHIDGYHNDPELPGYIHYDPGEPIAPG